MARQLDLRTGRPVWMAYRAPRISVEPLARDARAEVLVVGMGVSGAMIAEALTAEGREVLMIDRRGPMRGSTPAMSSSVSTARCRSIGWWCRTADTSSAGLRGICAFQRRTA